MSTVTFEPGFRLIDGTDLNDAFQGSQDVNFGNVDATSLFIGNATITGIVADSITNGITASATQTLVGAVGLTTTFNNISTVGKAGDAVRLATTTPGQVQWVFNNGASACAVFPADASTTIDGGGAGASVTVTNAKQALFVPTSTTTVISVLGGTITKAS